MMRHDAIKLVLLATLATPIAAHAQDEARGGAPALYGVNEVIVNYTRFSDRDASAACDVKREEIEQTIADALQASNVPAVLAESAKPALVGTVRVALTPEIDTFQDRSQGCVTYINLIAEAKHAARLAPINERRSFTVNYWRGGLIVGTQQSSHAMSMMRAAEKLAKDFAAEYKVAQPVTQRSEAQKKVSEREKQEELLNSLQQNAGKNLIKGDGGIDLKDVVPKKLEGDGAAQKLKFENMALTPTVETDPLAPTKP